MVLNTPPANDPTGQITSDQIGEGDGKTYGADIGPQGGQDMFAYDPIAGTFPPMERSASPASFTGGMGGAGLGGQAEPFPPGGGGQDGTLYEKRGF
jgi:hypothetical protein